jgi:ATP-binding cassette subfamily F protein 3
MLHINELTYRIGERTLLDGATVALPAGAKAGLVGRNGAGKTTLFRLITGEVPPESGQINLPRNARVGQVAQEAPGTGTALIDFVLAADTERAALLHEAESATDPHRIGEIHVRLADIDAHSAEARAAAILSGLGFDTAAQRQACADFSGGWRMRVALAAMLFSAPDLLLLDEPTNYLDLEGTLWLESYLARYPHSALVISHDRDLLNRAVQQIVHLEAGKLTVYRGGYDQFERQRRERQSLQLKLKKKQDDQRRHMQAFVDRFRAQATKARQAQSRLKALQRMEPVPGVVEDAIAPITVPSPQKPAPPPIVQMLEVDAGYGDKIVLRNLNLRIDPDDRIALLGKNGNGKSTFAKLISGRLEAMAGQLKRYHKIDVAYFAQHQLDELNPAQSAYDHVRALMGDATEAQVRARTAQIGLGTQKMDTAAAKLSGGEKARLMLGVATFHGPHLLILDEPTNHLDIETREALVHALLDYEGAVVLVSHDRHLIEACADRLWLVDGGTVAPFEGDMDDYARLILDKSGTGRSRNGREDTGGDKTAATAAGRRKQAAARRAELAPLRKDIKALERRIADAERDISRLDGLMADPTLFATDPDKGTALAKQRADAQKLLAASEERWLELSAELERQSAEP